MLNHPFVRMLSLYLVVAVFVLSLPAPGFAMLVPSEAGTVRAADAARVQTALESTAVKQRLMDYGLTPEEASARISKLSDEQLHQFASQIDSVQAGGLLGDVIFVLLVVAIVLVVLELTGHHVIVH